VNRRPRIEELLRLRNRIDAEIEQIEHEIVLEMEATKRAKAAARRASVPIRRRPLAVCGTDTGYYRHRRTLQEPACDACKLAHRVYEAERRTRREEDELSRRRAS
jgi:hypothetical protein